MEDIPQRCLRNRDHQTARCVIVQEPTSETAQWDDRLFSGTVLAPIPTAGLAAVDVIELAARVRDQMVENLREISVGLPNTQAKAASQEFEPELTPSPIEYADQGLIVTNEIVAEVQYSPSEGTSEASASEIPRCARVLKLDGSVSEFGAETDEEGNVLVERRDH